MRHRQNGITLYTVYNNKTDMPVMIDGTAQECALAMGIRNDSFYHIYRAVNMGLIKKWTIYKSGVLKKRKTSDLDKGISLLNVQILRSFAESGMSAKKTAEIEFFTLQNVYYHLKKLRKKYALNPFDKTELNQLLTKFSHIAV